MAIDYGTKRTGIAVSDPLRIIAGGLETVETKGLERWLAQYFAANDVSTIVIGKPMQIRIMQEKKQELLFRRKMVPLKKEKDLLSLRTNLL